MKIKPYIALLCIMLIVMPVFVAGQGVLLSPGIYMKLSGGTMILHNADWVNNGNYSDQNGTVIVNGTTNAGGSSVSIFTNLTIKTGATLNLESQSYTTVKSVMTVNGNLVLKSTAAGTASLIHNTDNVPAVAHRYINGAVEAWHFLSSPVIAQSINGNWTPAGTYGNGTGYDMYLWNEQTNCWIYQLNSTSTVNWNTTHPGSNFVPGRGYLYSVQSANPTKDFIGNLNNGNVSYGLTMGSVDVNLKGFNFVGNPYPSAIDWQATSGWTRNNLLSSGGGYDMWIWNPTANNYGVFNSFTGIGTNSVTRNIAAMQGYFVRATNAGNLILNNSVRVHDISGGWKSAEIIPLMLSLIVESEADMWFDEVRLFFGYRANEPPSIKLFSNVASAPSLFLPSENVDCTVRYLTDTIDYPIIPVKFKPGKDGNYTIKSILDYDNFETVILEDRQLHLYQNLKTIQTYKFSASKTNDAGRFFLHFGLIKNQTDVELTAKIYTEGTGLIVDLSSIIQDTEVSVYDILGRKIFQEKLQGKIKHTLNFKTGRQVLIVSLKNPDGSLSRKIIGS